jgi:hypothetical protein
MSVWDSIKGSVAPGGAARNLVMDVTGASNFNQAIAAGRQGDWNTALRQGGAGALKAGSLVVPGGLAARGVIAGGLGARAVAGGLMYGAGQTLAPRTSASPLTVGAQPSVQSQQAQAARLQSQASQFAQDQYRQQQLANQQRAQQMQNDIVRQINSSFSPEQIRALQGMGTQVGAMNDRFARERAAAAYGEPDWLRSMRGLSAGQIAEFERQEGEARGRFEDFLSRAGLGRERATAEGAQRERTERQTSTGRLASSRASLARAGLLPSTEGIAQESEQQRRSAGIAQARAERDSALRQIGEQESLARSELERFLGSLSRQQLAARQDREAAWQSARSQDFENWMRSQGFA